MSADREKLLLNLSIEIASAKELLSASEAFLRYLKLRFDPEEIDQVNEADHGEFDSGKIFWIKKPDWYFQVPIAVPLIYRLEKPKKAAPDQSELEILGKIFTFFRETQDILAELKGQTYTDDLTGLYNQRYLEVILDRELSLCKRNSTEFSVLFLDLDHFKNVNDTHGHLIGSRLLYEVGQEIKKTLRESDITFRYGGDEFVIILSHTGLDDAIFVAERVRVQIEKKRFLAKDGLEIRLTASIGVASVPLHAETKQEILKAADEALYGVKKAVRNKVIAATTTAKG